VRIAAAAAALEGPCFVVAVVCCSTEQTRDVVDGVLPSVHQCTWVRQAQMNVFAEMALALGTHND
jgi:hypothetical protein